MKRSIIFVVLLLVCATAYAQSQQQKELEKIKRLIQRPSAAELFNEFFNDNLKYFKTGKPSYFDIGPFPQFISGNPLEGFRLSVGGRTTSSLSHHLFVDAFFSYGFTDKKFKTRLGVEWSFKPYRGPHTDRLANALKLTYSYDVHSFSDPIGQPTKQSIFTWANRTADMKLTYLRLYQLQYRRAFEMGLNFSATVRFYQHYETFLMSFGPVYGDLPDYSMSEIKASVGFRNNVQLSHTVGIKGVFGSDYRQNLTTLTGGGIIKLGVLGQIKLRGDIGYQWSDTPYMLLPHTPTNTSYFAGELLSFAMIRPLEFIYDRYVQAGVEWNFKGLLFNLIPFNDVLNLNEVVRFRTVYATLSERNNPQFNTLLVPLPDNSGVLSNAPYMEVSVGLDDIFRILSIEYVWRLNYLLERSKPYGALLFGVNFRF